MKTLRQLVYERISFNDTLFIKYDAKEIYLKTVFPDEMQSSYYGLILIN